MVDNNIFIKVKTTIKHALKLMDKMGAKTLFVVDKDNYLLGVVSGGDIRRSLLKGHNLDGGVEAIMNKEPLTVDATISTEVVKKLMIDNKFEAIPVVDSKNQIKEILLWHKVFNEKRVVVAKEIDIPVVIMAGGKGTRLDPFTRILPKPLIPIGDKAIIEIIMDEYLKFGMKEFYISVNFKSKMIKAFFEERDNDYKLHYIYEEKPLGTAGSLKLLKDKINRPFFVSNCDIIIDDDYSQIYDFHVKEKNALTLVASIQHHVIPYGVCEIEEGHKLKGIIEKPEYDLWVNTGMYLLNPEMIDEIPDDEFFHITDLISKAMKKGYKVGVYPVSEKSWIDIGHWSEYKSAVEKLTV
jgi:dTDP-glucose pyrophosphorylase